MNKSITADETIRQLKEAISRKGDLPCLSSSLARIVESMKNLDFNDDELVNVVLSDFSLAQKVLRLANSPMYAAFGSVTTISMAIHVLGTEAIGHLAMGVKLLDNLGQAAETELAREELSKAVIAGAVARSVAVGVAGKDGESVAVAALMRSLGRLLVCFYLPAQFEEISQHQPRIDTEDRLAKQQLGLGFGDIAFELAQGWHLPEELADCAREPSSSASPHAQWVHAVTGYSRGYVDAVARGADADELRSLANEFTDSIGLASDELCNQAAEAVGSADADTGFANMWDNRRRESAATRSRTSKLEAGVDEIDRNQNDLTVSQVVGMATELLWESLGCRNALFFLHQASKGTYDLYLARGAGMQELVRKVSFEAAFSPNVVHLSLASAKPVYLTNPQEANISKRIPDWLKRIVPVARAMFLLPVAVQGKSSSLLYLDWAPGTQQHAFTADEQAQIDRLVSITSACLERAMTARVRSAVPA